MTTKPHITPKVDEAIRCAAALGIQKLLDMPLRAFQDYRTVQIVNLKIEDYEAILDVYHIIIAVDLSLTPTGAFKAVQISLQADPDAVIAVEDQNADHFAEQHDMIAIELPSVVGVFPRKEESLAWDVAGQLRTIVSNRIGLAKLRRKCDLAYRRRAG